MRFDCSTAVAAAAGLALAATVLGACSSPVSKPPLLPVTPIMLPPPMSAQQDISGGAWHWDGGEAGAPAGRDLYTVEFSADGRVLVRADCNRGAGRYSATADGRMTLSAIATTKVACPEGSLDATFLRELGEVDRYRMAGDTLELLLRSGAGPMRFSR